MFWVINFKGIFKQIVNIKNAQIIFINVFFLELPILLQIALPDL